jgi:hypothetical protein
MNSGTVRTLVAAALAATLAEAPRAEAVVPVRPRCCVCGITSDFVRHATLARRHKPWRWR